MADAKPKRTPAAGKAPQSVRVQITATINRPLMEWLDALGRETGRNRSEMLDRVIEFYRENAPAQPR